MTEPWRDETWKTAAGNQGPVAWFAKRQGADGFARTLNKKYGAYTWSGRGESGDWYASFKGPVNLYAEVKALMRKKKNVLRVTDSPEEE